MAAALPRPLRRGPLHLTSPDASRPAISALVGVVSRAEPAWPLPPSRPSPESPSPPSRSRKPTHRSAVGRRAAIALLLNRRCDLCGSRAAASASRRPQSGRRPHVFVKTPPLPTVARPPHRLVSCRHASPSSRYDSPRATAVAAASSRPLPRPRVKPSAPLLRTVWSRLYPRRFQSWPRPRRYLRAAPVQAESPGAAVRPPAPPLHGPLPPLLSRRSTFGVSRPYTGLAVSHRPPPARLRCRAASLRPGQTAAASDRLRFQPGTRALASRWLCRATAARTPVS